jgi:glycosyltransferase involved in cell wall biosynthesis
LNQTGSKALVYPKITIITPSYNQGRYLEETMLSVLNQSYPALEYMVIDGGSNDRSPEIIKKYADKLAWWTSEKDNGQAHAINKGLQRATGDIVCWINSDDVMQAGALLTVAENFQDDKVNCVIGRIQYFDEKGPLRKSGNVVKSPPEKTLGSGVVPQPAMYFRKSCYDKIGLLDEKLYLSFDAVWYMQYLVHYGTGRIREIPQTLVNFRFHSGSKTMNNSSGYNKERSSICYSIASQMHLKPLMDLLLQTNEPDISYYFKIPSNPLGIDIKKAMNYFVLRLAVEYYAQALHEKAARCFAVINPGMLDADSLAEYRKIKFRNNYLPAGLIKMLRKKSS